MTQLITNFKFNQKNILVLLIALFPISLVIGSALINCSIIIIDLLFLYILIKEKKLKFLDQHTFYLLLFLWGTLIVNMALSLSFENSFSRAFGFIRFIFFIFAIKFVLNKHKVDDKIIFISWISIFLIITIDIIFESIFGFNTLGFKNNFPGRISSFLHDELKIGNYYFGFILLSLSFIYYNYRKSFFLIFLVFFVSVSFLIGERSNFIKIFTVIFIFLFLIDKMDIWKKIIVLSGFFVLAFAIISQNEFYKSRFVGQLTGDLASHNYDVIKFYKFTTYAAHHNTAYQIFKNYPYFGVGLKNFRMESGDSEYINSEFRFNKYRQNTHPHQVHLEFLSELGLFGYISFFIFFYIFLKKSINSQLKNKNLYQLSGILFIIISFMPLIPSGSFFTTYGAAIFWLNFSIIDSFNS